MKSPKNVLLIGRRMIRAMNNTIAKVLLFLNPRKLNIIYSKLEYIIFYLNHILMAYKNNIKKNIYLFA